jgi:hypothetical protein
MLSIAFAESRAVIWGQKVLCHVATSGRLVQKACDTTHNQAS